MKKRLVVFLEFLLGGILLGIIEDFILITILKNEPINFSIFITVLLVTLPFAFIGEYVVDKVDFIKIFKLSKKLVKAEIFLEFLIFGVALGILEDLTAFFFAIGDAITIKVFLVAAIVAIPFAFVGEVLIDRIDVLKSFKKRKLVWKK